MVDEEQVEEVTLIAEGEEKDRRYAPEAAQEDPALDECVNQNPKTHSIRDIQHGLVHCIHRRLGMEQLEFLPRRKKSNKKKYRQSTFLSLCGHFFLRELCDHFVM